MDMDLRFERADIPVGKNCAFSHDVEHFSVIQSLDPPDDLVPSSFYMV